MGGLLFRRRDLILPGCGGNATLARLLTFAARWVHELRSIRKHRVGLGFSYRSGRYRPVGSPFSSAGCRRFSDMEAFWIRRSDLILPGCDENLLLIRAWDLIHLVSGASSTLARGATFPA